MLAAALIGSASAVFGDAVMPETYRFGTKSIEGTSLGGFTGHIVTPSAGMFWEGSDMAIATGYTMIAAGDGLAHIPFVNFGLFRQLELIAAMDSKEGAADLLIGTKWRFLDSGTTEAAVGFLGQVENFLGGEAGLGGQVFLVSTFHGALFDQKALTSVLIGYTFKDGMTGDIDFSVGFDAPLLPSVFNDSLSFVFDVGNVSYSMNPSGNDTNRGIVNAGIRMNPLQLADKLRFMMNVYGMDLLDGADRSFAAGLALQMDLR